MLPTEFGNPLWFTDADLVELKGTTLHRATEVHKKILKTLFDEKVKKLVEKLLVIDGNPESEVRFEDFRRAHIITAVIGSGILSLAWATSQLGWIAGPTVLFLFSFVTFYTSSLLATCYRTGDPDTGKRTTLTWMLFGPI
ncbi:hypothetical protein ACS0TY_002416 [Phlomoides rotata]